MTASRGVDAGADKAGPYLPNDSSLEALAGAHLGALARAPRPTGTDAAATARRYCAGVLTSLGFDVVERPFAYSAAVGELGTPASGVAAVLIIGAAGASALGGAPAAALALVCGGALLVILIGRWAARRGVLELPVRRRHGVNLEARRRGEVPAVWLVAHADSKSQPISLVVRAGGIVVLAITWITAGVLAAAGVSRRDAWLYVMAAALVGATPVMASTVGRRSAGAVDNASGVATVLLAASLDTRFPLGVLITDAEELGLAGARAWCAEATAPRVPVLNCDGVDDGGMLTVMWTRPRTARLERAVQTAAEMAQEPLRVIPLVPGVLVDGLAFSAAGWEAVTLSRGSLDTLRRIHTSRDDLAHLRGAGIVSTARVLARAASLIAEQG